MEKKETIPVVLVGPLNDLYGMPSLGLGILKASLGEKGIACMVIPANMRFYEAAGRVLFERIRPFIMNHLVFELLFAPSAHDIPPQSIAEKLRKVAGSKTNGLERLPGGGCDATLAEIFMETESLCSDFIDSLASSISALKPKIVGCSNHFQLTNASVALARALKRRIPDVIFVMGGSNCEETMGEEIASSFPVIDYVFQGEADFAFARFCQEYLENRKLPAERVIRCKPAEDMNAVPVPDYDDFFRTSAISPRSAIYSFESSRGCWWARKSQCKFCGESAHAKNFRSKHPDRVLEELKELKRKFPEARFLFATDSIFPHSYFSGFLEKLEALNLGVAITYETRANLTLRQMIRMKRSGISRIMPGIESLSTRLLKLVGKGTDAPGNICLLRGCRETGLQAVWLLLIGIPGDLISDYKEQMRIIAAIQHLSPPRISPIRIQRFSPYFEAPENYGISAIRPLASYEIAFPATVDASRLAYFFTAEFPCESRDHPEALAPLKQQMERWSERWREQDPPELRVVRTKKDRWIKDTRDCAVAPETIVDEKDEAVLRQCRKGISPDRVKFTDRVPNLLERFFILELDGKLLSVVCEPPRASGLRLSP